MIRKIVNKLFHKEDTINIEVGNQYKCINNAGTNLCHGQVYIGFPKYKDTSVEIITNEGVYTYSIQRFEQI